MEFERGDRIKVVRIEGDEDNRKRLNQIGVIYYISNTHAAVSFDDGTDEGGIYLKGCIKIINYDYDEVIKRFFQRQSEA